MGFDAELAAIRFGTGLSPRIAAPRSAEEMLSSLTGPDKAANAFPIPSFASQTAAFNEMRELRKYYRQNQTDADAKKAVRRAYRELRQQGAHATAQVLRRRAQTEDGFRERLTAFWADHFTAVAPDKRLRPAQTHYVEEAIRPHVAGNFSEMLRAATTHPMMLLFLNQNASMGENSRAAKNRKGKQGLNENLARELLELHTLGVGANYTQTDVRQLAELLTGLSFDRDFIFMFKMNFTEPGAETVLSRSYGGGTPRIEDIHAALDDLARHPATARHIAGKLAMHFTGDTPDPGLVSAMEAAYLRSDGHLPDVYATLLDHPAAWSPELTNVKQPIDFMGSTLRALDISAKYVPSGNLKKMREFFLLPLELMGQNWATQLGPDGWPEEDDIWITPQRLAARMQWAMITPFRILGALPDPREFVEVALGRYANETVRFAARAAETRPEGVGIVLASPAFQRM
ncbi:MAG: DUF1800 domain-containing protein [Roseovarius sp.]